MPMEERYCSSELCLNLAAQGVRQCHKCRKRGYRARYKVRAAYQLLRSNAWRRNIAFNISLEEFEMFCEQTDYIELKGIEAEDLSIDRIDPRKGYEFSNMQVLTVRDNSKKRHQDGRLGWSRPIQRSDDVPF